MFIKNLKLNNFKNYEKADLEFSPGFNILTGNNGQGKTNLLDAIYLLCMTKSYFQYQERNLVKFEESFFKVEGTFYQDTHKSQVLCKFQMPGSKSFQLEGKEVRRYADFIGRFPVVIIAPNDIQLIEEGSEERRRFIDISICQSNREYLDALSKYQKLTKQRNSLLKQINMQGKPQSELLEYYNDKMASLCEIIYAIRAEFTSEISAMFHESYQTITDGSEDATCAYLPDVKGSKSDFLEAFRAAYPKDQVLERTTRGIHRDDLEFILNNQPVKKTGSQGQIKSAIFAAKLSQFQWIRKHNNSKPILLLDDIFDKLDHHRVTRILKIIDSEAYGQTFITDTYAGRISDILPHLTKDSALFHIESGNAVSHV